MPISTPISCRSGVSRNWKDTSGFAWSLQAATMISEQSESRENGLIAMGSTEMHCGRLEAYDHFPSTREAQLVDGSGRHGGDDRDTARFHGHTGDRARG